MKPDCTHICGIRSWFGEISHYLSYLGVGAGLWVVWQNIDPNQWQLMLALIKISQYRVCLWYWEPAYQPFQICISLHLYSVSLHFVFVCHYILYLCVIVFCICVSLYFVFVCHCILYFCVIEFCISGLGTGWSLYWLSGRSSQPRLDFLHKRLRPRRRPSITWCNLAEMIFVFLYSLFCISALFICLCNRDFLSWSPFCAYSQKLIMSEICTVTLSSAEQIHSLHKIQDNQTRKSAPRHCLMSTSQQR